MKVALLCIGSYEDASHRSIAESYINKIKKMSNFEVIPLSLKKKYNAKDPKSKNKLESDLLLSNINKEDYVILLDEKGKQMRSLAFAEKLNQWSYAGHKRIVFVIGGAFGFGPDIYKRSNMELSMSTFTFNHQLARLVFLEQLYRGYSILNNLPFHNE